MAIALDLKEDTPSQGPWTVAIRGEIDLYTAPALREAFDRAVSAGKEVVLDLSGTEFIDSTGLGVLVDGHRRLQEAGGRLVVVSTHPAIARTLEITVLDRVLELTGTVDEARAALTEPQSR